MPSASRFLRSSPPRYTHVLSAASSGQRLARECNALSVVVPPSRPGYRTRSSPDHRHQAHNENHNCTNRKHRIVKKEKLPQISLFDVIRIVRANRRSFVPGAGGVVLRPSKNGSANSWYSSIDWNASAQQQPNESILEMNQRLTMSLNNQNLMDSKQNQNHSNCVPLRPKQPQQTKRASCVIDIDSD